MVKTLQIICTKCGLIAKSLCASVLCIKNNVMAVLAAKG